MMMIIMIFMIVFYSDDQTGTHNSEAYGHGRMGYNDDYPYGQHDKNGIENQFREDIENGQKGDVGFYNTTEMGGVTAHPQDDKTRGGVPETGAGERDAKGNLKKGKKPVAKKVTKKVDSLEDKFKIPKMRTPPPIKMPARGDKTLEKDSASAKDRKMQEIEQLRAEMRRAKQERVEVEKEREKKVRRAKNLQNQTLQKRNQGKYS